MLASLAIIPVLLAVLAALKSALEIAASFMSILANISSMIKTSWEASAPLQKGLWIALTSFAAWLWTWIKWFCTEVLWNGAMVVFHSPTAAAMMIFLMVCTASATRISTEIAYRDRLEAAEKAGEHTGYAKGHAEGLKEAKAPQKYKPNR